MREDNISRTQLMALLWAGLMAPAAELLPTLLLPDAGRGAWLAAALAAPLVLAAGWLLDRLAGEDGLSRGFVELLGPVPGRLLLLIYIMWGELLLVLRLRLCAQRLLASGERDGALWFFLLGVAAVLLWIGRGKLAAFARAGQIFLVLLLAAAGAVLVLSLSQARLERLLPLGWEPGLLRAAASAAGAMGWGLFAAFLTGQVRDQGERKGWHWLFWGAGGCLLLALAQAVILGNLGEGLAGRLDNPFFTLAKSMGVEGAFQRVESVASALWTFADLTMAGLILFALQAMAGELFSRERPGWVPWAAVLLGAGAALTAFSGAGQAEWWGRKVVPPGGLLLGLAVPAALLPWHAICRRRKDMGTSCAEKEKQIEDIGPAQGPEKNFEKREKRY